MDRGISVYQTKNTLKVVGGITEDCRRVVCALYQPAIDSLVPVSTTEAEPSWFPGEHFGA